MKPDAAAERLAEVKIELAAGILMKLDPRQASIILNEMDSKAAATLTGVMASARARKTRHDPQLALACRSRSLHSPAAARPPSRRSACAPALSPVGSGLAAEGRSIYTYPEKPAAPARNSRCGTTARAGSSPIRARWRPATS